mgnify:CR=1 FL=1
MKPFTISIIACVGKNRAIGKDNKLLWQLPEDLKHFRTITTGHPVIMGQKTFESLGGKPLPKRINIVLTQDVNYHADGIVVVHSISDAITAARKEGANEIFFIGGGQVYAQALPLADKLYLTVVDDSPAADTYFPDYSSFKKVITIGEGQRGKLKYQFLELTR